MAQSGGSFLPGDPATITGNWTFSGTSTFTNATLTTPTLTTPTVTDPAISGTVTGGASYTAPTITGPTITGTVAGLATYTKPTLTDPILSNGKAVATVTYTSNTTPATITGLSWTLVAAATYLFELNLPVTMTTNGGLSVAFALTTATLTSINYQTYAATAADATTAVSTNGTTTTSGTLVFDSSTAAYTHVLIKGCLVVGTGGTFAWQASQHASAGGGDVTTLLTNGYAMMTRIA